VKNLVSKAPSFRAMLCRVVALIVAAAGLAGPTPSSADEVPWRQRAFDLQASNEPLSSFLLRVLTFDGISATMSPTVGSGRVNGRFRGKTEKVFKELADTYGLTWYYDGQTLHVYSIAEIETRLLQVDPVDVPRIDRTLKQMRLSDARFPLRIANSEGQVLVSGPPRYVELVEQVVGRVADSPSRPKAGVEVRVFRLRHARAADTMVAIGGTETRVAGVASTLNALLNDSRREPPPESGARSLPRSLRGLRGQGLAAVGNSPQVSPLTPSGNGGGASTSPSAQAGQSGASASNSPLALSQAGAVAASASGGRDAAPSSRDGVARADERLNAVIIRDVNERMPMYQQLINSLDVETALVEIEATVIDVSEDKSEQLGIDWRLHSKNVDILSSPNSLGGNGTNPQSAARDLLFAGNPSSVGKGLVGTLLFGNERNFFLSRLNVLAETGDARLISRPRILTTENIEAVLQSTKEFYVRVAGRDQVDLFNVSLGMLMRVTPTMVEDEQGRRFKLQVRIEDGNTNSGQQVDQIPVVNRNAIATQAVIGEGQSLLIGGYVIEERNNTKQGVPGLSDVPVLGWLFGQKGNAVRRSERMFLITPRLIRLNAPSIAAPPDAPTITIPPTVFPRPKVSPVAEREP
jgi:type III secretion protein C